MSHLCGALTWVYNELGFATATAGDEAFRELVIARSREPTSKLDSLRVLSEAGLTPASYGNSHQAVAPLR